MNYNSPQTQQSQNLLALILQACPVYGIGNMVCSTPHGKFMVDVRDSVIGKSLLLSGEYCYQEMQRWFEFLSIGHGKDFIDIGANIGTTSIPLALDNRFNRIVCFEPDPTNFGLLQFNVDANNLRARIRALNLAVGSSNSRMEFELSAENLGDHRIRFMDLQHGSYDEAGRRKIKVDCVTLDSMVEGKTVALDSLALIKSDTQGSEGHIFRGAQKLLGMRRFPRVIEFWPYGLQRSGIETEAMIELVTAYFTEMVELPNTGESRRAPIAGFSTLFTRYTHCDATRWCNLILIP